jgi:hypothetical protein
VCNRTAGSWLLLSRLQPQLLAGPQFRTGRHCHYDYSNNKKTIVLKVAWLDPDVFPRETGMQISSDDDELNNEHSRWDRSFF